MTYRLLLTAAALLPLAACGKGDVAGGNAADAGAEMAEVPDVDPALVISGTVLAPEGASLDGALAMACLTPRETCAKEASAPVKMKDGVATFQLVVPEKGDYHITIWKDVNGNKQPDAGDLLANANNLEPVASGARLTPMTAFVRTDEAMTTNVGGLPYALADAGSAAAAVKEAGLVGRWSQHSTGSEIVIQPKIKLQAAMATGYGTNLGGTFGPGSATNTTIVYEGVPMPVKRSMTLDVAPDGTFRLSADLERTQGKCRSVHQEKYGVVRVEGGKLTLAVADARQRCGNGKVESLEEKDESYSFSRSGSGFQLTGKNVNWAFTKA